MRPETPISKQFRKALNTTTCLSVHRTEDSRCIATPYPHNIHTWMKMSRTCRRERNG